MMRLPLTIGDETPSPASGTFQATFSVALHRSGSFVSPVDPLPAGPRHEGQSEAASEALASSATAIASLRAFIVVLVQKVRLKPDTTYDGARSG
jgi:hypothetical protein